jgi:eukaryotic translation initiation factor 2C
MSQHNSSSGSSNRSRPQRGGHGTGPGSSALDQPSRQPQLDNRRERTKIRDRIVEFFEREGIEQGTTQLEPKMDPGTVCRGQQDFQTNAFGIKCADYPLYKYHIEVSGVRGAGRAKPFFLTKRSNDDCVAADRKTRCREVFMVMKTVCTDLFINDEQHKYYYDLQSTLVTTTPLPQAHIQFSLQPVDYAGRPPLESFTRLDIEIKQCETENEVRTGDMEMAKIQDFDKYNRSHQAWIELATSQHALFNPEDICCLSGGKMYLITPERFIDRQIVDRCNAFSDDKFIGIGVKKSAKYVEGPKGRNHQNVALFVDPLKTAFFRQISIEQYLRNKNVNVNDFNDVANKRWLIKGLYVFNKHLAGKRAFQVTGLARETARTKIFKQNDGTEISVEDYFYEKYGVQVNPNAPLVMGKSKTELLPIDQATIDDNQPAPKNKMTQREDSDMIKIAATPPATLVREIDGYIGALGLDRMNLETDGIKVLSKRLTVKGRILQNPTIQFGENRDCFPNEEGLWNLQGKKFLRGSQCAKWGLLRNGRDRVAVTEYKNAFVQMCGRQGIQIAPTPDLEGEIRDDLEDWFKRAKQCGIEFLAFITDKQIKNQGDIKMLERKYEITTQNVTSKVANDAAGRGTATLENIVQKTNPKLGGTNYTIKHNQQFIDDAFGKDFLVIGIALSHSGSIDDVQRQRGGTAASTQLSSVGYAANTGQDSFEFIGDMVPNNPHRIEILELIPGIIETVIEKYNTNKGHFPSSMILYLNGSSEGEFGMLKRFEIPLVHRKMVDAIGRKIPLTVIVPQRSHMARINKLNPNPLDKGPRQNLQPGVVVDTGLVHPTLNEFFLNSHVAIQGTARTPKYTILHNDNERAAMDAIQHVTYYLCYGHQIVNSPTSLPAPVYCAMQYAERGTKVFKALAGVEVEEIVERWNYDSSAKFRNLRINA